MTTPKMGLAKRVGYWWSEKKSQKMNVSELARHFVDRGFEFVRLDLGADLERQGPFDAIIHKLSDYMCKMDCDDEAMRKVNAFEQYVKRHPEVIVIDSLDNVRKVLDRYRQYKIIEDSELAIEDGVFTPTFVEMTSTDVAENLRKMKTADVKFPFVCKPVLAHGTKYAHKMSIIFDESGLHEINPPCVAQTFINHNARLFKLFIIKDRYFVIERPSIKNFKRNHKYETVHFDSHDISKPYSCSALTELDEDDAKRIACGGFEPESERLDRIVKVITNELGLFLLGIDVIIENETGRYAIIDMNSFPGYDGVDNFLELYCKLVINEIGEASANQKQRQRKPASCNNSIAKSSTPPTKCLNDEDNNIKNTTTNTDNPPDHQQRHHRFHHRSQHHYPHYQQPQQQQRNESNNGPNEPDDDPKTMIEDKAKANMDIRSVDPKIPSPPAEPAEPGPVPAPAPQQNDHYSPNDFDSGIDTSDSCDERKNSKKPEISAKKKFQHCRATASSTTNSSSSSNGNLNIADTIISNNNNKKEQI